MEAMRVLQVFTIMDRGGAESMIMNYYRNMDRTRVQFDFLVHRKERGAFDDEIESLGGRIYRMMPIHPRSLRAYQSQVASFFDHHHEHRIIHGNCSELGVYVYREARRRGVPTIIAHAHNAPSGWDLKSPFRFIWKHQMRRYITTRFSCGRESSLWLFGRGNTEPVIILNNAVDSKKFRFDSALREEMRKNLGIGNRFVVGHVGRFDPQKNHSFLLDIFAEIHQQNQDALLVLVGTGSLKGSMEEKVKARGLEGSVLFLGLRSDVSALLNAFDVFLFPSRFEGLPLTLVEAQANGLKCLVSEGVPKESAITDLVEYHSLKESPKKWAEAVLRYHKGYERQDMQSIIAQKGFDSVQNAKWLEAYYSDENRKHQG